MRKLRVAYQAFTGNGYQEFVVFAKRALKAGQGVVTVVYLKGDPNSGARRPAVVCCSSFWAWVT